MDVTPLITRDRQVIQSYALKNSSGSFRISSVIHAGAVFVTPERTVAWNAPDTAAQLTIAHVEPLLAELQQLEVLLIGTGETFHFLPPALLQELRAFKLKPDMMDTGAACRTYNVLLAEARLVGALLLPVI